MKFELTLDDAYEAVECIINCDLDVEAAQEYIKAMLHEINGIAEDL